MVRVKEIKDKLRLNASFRTWKASHTFGGTTKAKSLYIAGFRRKNFYYVAGVTVVTLLVGGISGGVGVRNSIQSAVDRGQLEGAFGQLVETQITQSRTRTLTSDGILILTTEITNFATTVQRGGGTTFIKTTGIDGEMITIPGAITFVTNSNNKVQEKTLVGSTFFVTETDGLTVPTTVFGAATTFTDSSGDDTTMTVFSELTVVTNVDGGVSTSLRSQSRSEVAQTRAQTLLSTQVDAFTSTQINGEVITGMKTTVETMISMTTASTTRTTTSTSTHLGTTSSSSSLISTSTSSPSRVLSPSSSRSPMPTSSSRPASMTSPAGGGGGSDLFVGEGTFYTPGLGSCGIDSTEADFVAALSKVLFDATGVANSNNNPYCGRKALVKAVGGSGRRLLEREIVTQVGATKKIWYTRNITLGESGIWGSGIQKKSRRHRISLEIEGRKEGIQKYPSRPILSNRHILIHIATSVTIKYAPSTDISLQPIITPPPSAYNKDTWKRQAGGGGVTVTMVDRCPVCAQYDLDLSPAAFDLIGNQDAGRIEIEWSWLD